MAVDFPSSPTTGQTFTSGGTTWIWDGVKWTSTSAATGLYLPLTGGTMTGDLILNRDAVAPLQAATFEQVQARGAGDNRIINGDMRIDQRNNGAGGTAGGYTIDRWAYQANIGLKINWSRNSTAFLPFPYSLRAGVAAAYSPLAADFFVFQQFIEADMVSDFCWGTATAQPVTLSFWVYCTVAGTYGGAIRNAALTRAYPFSYSVPAATWTYVALTIPGDAAGAWVMSGNAAALTLSFDLGSGATNRAPAGAWISGNYIGANGAGSIVATVGAAFNVTGVKLEIGSIATPFNRKSLTESLADCQRYFQQVGAFASGWSNAGNIVYSGHELHVPMRAAPTGVIVAGTIANTVNNTAQNVYVAYNDA